MEVVYCLQMRALFPALLCLTLIGCGSSDDDSGGGGGPGGSCDGSASGGAAFECKVLEIVNQHRAQGATCGGSAQAPVGPSIKAGDTLSWDVTTDVASMLAGSNASDGWLLKPLVDDPLDGEELHLASRESPDPSARPKLELSYLVCP